DFAQAERPARRTWDTYRDPNDPDRPMPSSSTAQNPAPRLPEREMAGDEHAIIVQLAQGHVGLLDYLRATHGPGILEDLDARQVARQHDWKNVGSGRTLVSVTQRRVTRKFTALPDVLTVILSRALLNGGKTTRAFAMPVDLALVEHPQGAAPRTRQYR